jgi:hypothetical protein
LAEIPRADVTADDISWTLERRPAHLEALLLGEDALRCARCLYREMLAIALAQHHGTLRELARIREARDRERDQHRQLREQILRDGGRTP